MAGRQGPTRAPRSVLVVVIAVQGVAVRTVKVVDVIAVLDGLVSALSGAWRADDRRAVVGVPFRLRRRDVCGHAHVTLDHLTGLLDVTGQRRDDLVNRRYRPSRSGSVGSCANNPPPRQVERIVQQIVCNDQKADLTDAQRARGIQTMLDAGVSVAKVAKLISTKKAVVVAAETAGKSTEAMEALADGQLNRSQRELDQAGEFGDDRGLVLGADQDGVIGIAVGVGAVDRGVSADRCEPAGRPLEVPGDGVPRWQGPTAGPIEASQA